MIYNISLQFFPVSPLIIQNGDVRQIGKFEDFAVRHAKF